MSTYNLRYIEELVNDYFLKDSIQIESQNTSGSYFRIIKFKYIEKDDNERVAFAIYNKLKWLPTFLNSMSLDMSLEYSYENGYVYVTIS